MFGLCEAGGTTADRADFAGSPRKSADLAIRRFATVSKGCTAKNRYCQRFYSGAAVFQRFKSVPPRRPPKRPASLSRALPCPVARNQLRASVQTGEPCLGDIPTRLRHVCARPSCLVVVERPFAARPRDEKSRPRWTALPA